MLCASICCLLHCEKLLFICMLEEAKYQAAVSNVKNEPSNLITQVFLYISISNSTIMLNTLLPAVLFYCHFIAAKWQTREKNNDTPYLCCCAWSLRNITHAGQMNTKSACYKDLRVQVNTSYCNPRSRPVTGLMPCNTQPCPSRSVSLYVKWCFFFFVLLDSVLVTAKLWQLMTKQWQLIQLKPQYCLFVAFKSALF